jgi:hypothetical protein
MNALPSVFNTEASDHCEFYPVKDWIYNGKGKMVYGGTTYCNELDKLPRYLHLIAELNRQRKVTEINKSKVDQSEKMVINSLRKSKCNDAHIIAIVDVSGCRLVCTKDDKSNIYIKDKKLYGSPTKPPKIYKGLRHRGLLHDRNIVTCRYAIC